MADDIGWMQLIFVVGLYIGTMLTLVFKRASA